jgi:hypothetical protein
MLSHRYVVGWDIGNSVDRRSSVEAARIRYHHRMTGMTVRNIYVIDTPVLGLPDAVFVLEREEGRFN